jgi:hypothetical protein
MGQNVVALLIAHMFLSENILLPVNADGYAINMENIGVNVSARVIMMAIDSETYDALPSIFSS